MMEKVIVYRFEASDGQGPWSTRSTKRTPIYVYNEHLLDGETRPGSMPPPDGDGDDLRDHFRRHEWGLGGYVCAFQTLHLLSSVFVNPPGRKALADMGCPLWAFEVDAEAVVYGKVQVIFDPKRGRRLHQIDPITLEPIH